eukprot:6910-Heterococcus_DN1.PRE.2
MERLLSSQGGSSLPQTLFGNTSANTLTHQKPYANAHTHTVHEWQVIYHMEGAADADGEDMLSDVHTNNIRIFTSALNSEEDNAFYLFSVGGGTRHPLNSYLPQRFAKGNRMCVLHWQEEVIDAVTASATAIALLGPVVNRFSAVMYLTLAVRGPFYGRNDGSWLQQFVSVLDPEEGVVAVGPTIACIGTPHLRTYAYAVSTLVLPALVAYQLSLTEKDSADRQTHLEHVEVSMSQFLYHAGFTVGDLHGRERQCTDSEQDNPTRKCNIRPEDEVFVHFGGDVLLHRVLCHRAVVTITESTQALIDSGSSSSAVQKSAVAIWPETTTYNHNVN